MDFSDGSSWQKRLKGLKTTVPACCPFPAPGGMGVHFTRHWGLSLRDGDVPVSASGLVYLSLDLQPFMGSLACVHPTRLRLPDSLGICLGIDLQAPGHCAPCQPVHPLLLLMSAHVPASHSSLMPSVALSLAVGSQVSESMQTC